MRFEVLAKLYGVTLLAFLVIDFAWLGVVARGFYRDRLGPLMRPSVAWGPAVLFYLLFVGGLLFFAVGPVLGRGSLGVAMLRGGFFGLVAYATYDLTNLATIDGFPTAVAVVDMLWGFVLAAIVAGVAYLVAPRLA